MTNFMNAVISSISWINPSTLGFYSILLNPTNKNQDLRKSLTKNLISYCKKHIEIAKNDGFGIAMEAKDYNWGSNGTVVSRAMNYILANRLIKEEKYKGLAYQHIHYNLGYEC